MRKIRRFGPFYTMWVDLENIAISCNDMGLQLSYSQMAKVLHRIAGQETNCFPITPTLMQKQRKILHSPYSSFVCGHCNPLPSKIISGNTFDVETEDCQFLCYETKIGKDATDLFMTAEMTAHVCQQPTLYEWLVLCSGDYDFSYALSTARRVANSHNHDLQILVISAGRAYSRKLSKHTDKIVLLTDDLIHETLE